MLRAMAITVLHAVDNRKLLASTPKDSCDLKFLDEYNVLRSYRSA